LSIIIGVAILQYLNRIWNQKKAQTQ